MPQDISVVVKMKGMANTSWKNIKKDLPYNYAQLVVDKLKEESIDLKTSQIYDIIRGKNKNPGLCFSVWREINRISKMNARLRKKAESVKPKK